MNLLSFPVWVIPTAALSLALIGVLMMLFRAHHSLKRRVGTLTPYSNEHATNLQDRVRKIVTASAEQRETLTRHLEEGVKNERLQRQADDLDRIAENRKRAGGRP